MYLLQGLDRTIQKPSTTEEPLAFFLNIFLLDSPEHQTSCITYPVQSLFNLNTSIKFVWENKLVALRATEP